MREQQEAADRLEAALDRIEQLTRTPPPSADPARNDAVNNAALAARLDQLITHLRAALDEAEA